MRLIKTLSNGTRVYCDGKKHRSITEKKINGRRVKCNWPCNCGQAREVVRVDMGQAPAQHYNTEPGAFTGD